MPTRSASRSSSPGGDGDADGAWGLVDRCSTPLAWAAAAGVVVYVTSWAVAGAWRAGYDPVSQAISELFARGTPAGPRALMLAALVATGLLLAAFGPVLHRALPGRGALGPALASISGVLTVMIVAFPCSAGCPGFSTTVTDSMHTVVAGTGYLALIAAPVAIAWRVRGHDRSFALVSIALAALAAAGFAIHTAGIAPGFVGLEQRIFNTTADAWYVVAAGVVIRRDTAGRRHPRHPRRTTTDQPSRSPSRS